MAADVERQLQIALVIQLAELTGTMDRGLELTTEWLFNRYSFGRPLASYQALKHRFADMRAWLEAAHAMADAAAQHVQEETGRAGEYVSAGKSFLGAAALEVLQECVQFHGGIGVTFEHDLHLYLRRAVVDAQLYGTVADHRERLTTILESRAWDDEDQMLGEMGVEFLMRQVRQISGGTIEMSRNAVSERLLGMPREARRDNDVAFRDVPRSAPSR